MKKTINKLQADGYYYFLLIFVLVLILGAISLFSSTGFSSVNNSAIIDTLNSESAVYFDFGSYELKPESFKTLDVLSAELISSPESRLEIYGYTDNIGSDGFNLILSGKRAEAVKNYLVQKGCRQEQIITEAKGKYEPINDNFSEQERAMNRRVEFKWLKQTTGDIPKDNEYVNSNFKKISSDELQGEISARDTTGEPIKGIEEKDVEAVLKWNEDSASGTVHFLPIDDKKKIAFTLVLDYSPSMFSLKQFNKKSPKGDKILQMETAVKSFIGALGTNMFVKVIKFGTEIDVIQPFTKSKEIMTNAVDLRSYPRGGTALFASIYAALKDTVYNSNPTIMKTVIAFTDGMDNASGMIIKDSLFTVSGLNSEKVYTIGLLDKNDEYSTGEERRKGEADLKEISGKTGGFFYYAHNADALEKIYNQIFNQITNSYKVSIKWDKEKLPPKGTDVTAFIRVNVNGKIRSFFKDYVME